MSTVLLLISFVVGYILIGIVIVGLLIGYTQCRFDDDALTMTWIIAWPVLTIGTAIVWAFARSVRALADAAHFVGKQLRAARPSSEEAR